MTTVYEKPRGSFEGVSREREPRKEACGREPLPRKPHGSETGRSPSPLEMYELSGDPLEDFKLFTPPRTLGHCAYP